MKFSQTFLTTFAITAGLLFLGYVGSCTNKTDAQTQHLSEVISQKRLDCIKATGRESFCEHL